MENARKLITLKVLARKTFLIIIDIHVRSSMQRPRARNRDREADPQ